MISLCLRGDRFCAASAVCVLSLLLLLLGQRCGWLCSRPPFRFGVPPKEAPIKPHRALSTRPSTPVFRLPRPHGLLRRHRAGVGRKDRRGAGGGPPSDRRGLRGRWRRRRGFRRRAGHAGAVRVRVAAEPGTRHRVLPVADAPRDDAAGAGCALLLQREARKRGFCGVCRLTQGGLGVRPGCAREQPTRYPSSTHSLPCSLTRRQFFSSFGALACGFARRCAESACAAPLLERSSSADRLKPKLPPRWPLALSHHRRGGLHAVLLQHALGQAGAHPGAL